jgi:hypothetical protein
MLIQSHSTAGDERSTRDPAVREKARTQHIANAAEWLRRIKDFANAPAGSNRDTMIEAYRLECGYANIEPAV